MNTIFEKYQWGGARALVLLHDRHMRQFLSTWKRAKKAGVILPDTSDPAYQSIETFLRHVLKSAGGYMVWMCKKLNLPDPGIDDVPAIDEIEKRSDDYLNHVLERWTTPLANVPEDKFYKPLFTSRWGVDYCIEAMLEHAVMHPIRHEFQLLNLMTLQKKN
jgi:hypothetical protein